MRSKTGHALLVLALLATACGDDTGDEAEDRDGAVDPSTTQDGGKADAGASDAGGGLDSAVGQDASTLADAAADSATLDAAVGDAASADGAAADAAAADAATTGATFTRVQEILLANCGNCHTSGNSGMLKFQGDKAVVHAALVGVLAKGSACGGLTPARTRVVAGNLATSLLIHKLEGGSSLCGDQMPKGKTPLSTALIAEVRSWIAAGALNN